MIKLRQVPMFLAAVAVLCLTPLAFSQNVTLELNNGGQYTMDGVYVGPYNFTETPQNGTPQAAPLICDDFKDDVYVGESWTASVTSLTSINSNSTGLMFYNQTAGSASIFGMTGNFIQGYEAMGYLASQMMPLVGNSANSATIGYMAYAIWAIFEPSQVQNWLKSDPTAWAQVQNYVKNALSFVESKNFSLSSLAGWQLLTPTSWQGAEPQEYLQYVPEGGSALLYLLLAGVTCIGAMYNRSRRQGYVTK